MEACHDEDKHSVKNMGWIHNDLNSQINWQLAGIIYLTPDADPDTGTSLYDLREDKASTTETQIRIVNSQPEKCAFYLDQKYDEVEYKETLEKHLESFTEKTIFQNIYNRLIMYDSNEFHRANNFHNDGENRLTLVFFVSDIEIAKTPLKRIREYNDFDADIKDIIGKIKKREWLNKK